MLEIVVNTENWERHVRVSAEELAGLVRRIGGAGDLFLSVQRIPDLPDVFAQVWHKAGGDYTLEYRDGAADRHFQAMADEPEVVIAAMTGWARQEVGWDDGLAWSLLDMGPAREVPPLALAEGECAELEKRVREVLAGGYASRAGLAELAEEYLVTKDRRPVSREQAQALADRLWLERVAEQAEGRGRPTLSGSPARSPPCRRPVSRPARTSPVAVTAAGPRSAAKAGQTPAASSTFTPSARSSPLPATD